MSVTPRQFVAALNEVCQDIAVAFPRIDHGGCGLSALTFSEVFNAFGLETKFRLVLSNDSDKTDVTTVRNDMIEDNVETNWHWKDWSEYGIEMRHVITLFKIGCKWYGVDATTGCIRVDKCHGKWDDYRIAKGEFDKQDLVDLVANLQTWNPAFRCHHSPRQVKSYMKKRLRTLKSLFN